jgi:hypothetical protein
MAPYVCHLSAPSHLEFYPATGGVFALYLPAQVKWVVLLTSGLGSGHFGAQVPRYLLSHVLIGSTTGAPSQSVACTNNTNDAANLELRRCRRVRRLSGSSAHSAWDLRQTGLWRLPRTPCRAELSLLGQSKCLLNTCGHTSRP